MHAQSRPIAIPNFPNAFEPGFRAFRLEPLQISSSYFTLFTNYTNRTKLKVRII